MLAPSLPNARSELVLSTSLSLMAWKAEPPLLFLSIPEILDQIHIEFHVVWRETHTQTHRERKGRGGERKESEREAERQKDRQTKKVRMEKLDFLTINVV